jgi:hypothetical protein
MLCQIAIHVPCKLRKVDGEEGERNQILTAQTIGYIRLFIFRNTINPNG